MRSCALDRLADSGLIARTIDQEVLWTCASPAYLQDHGEPKTPDHLSTHTCVLFRLPSTGRAWPWRYRIGNRDVTHLPESDVRLGDGEALVEAAVAGPGLVQVPSYIAEREMERGRLVEVLQDYRPAPTPISLVYPANRHVPPRVKALADALLKRHGDAGAQQAGP